MPDSIISPCRAEKQPPITHSILHGACEQRYICHQLRPKATGIVRQKARKKLFKRYKRAQNSLRLFPSFPNNYSHFFS